MKGNSANDSKTYSRAIDIYKFLFTVGVCLMHYEGVYFLSDNRIFEGFYLAVDFFFVLSGFFLCNSVKSQKYDSAWQYTRKRVNDFWGYNLIMLLFFVLKDVYLCIIAENGLKDVILLGFKLFMNSINEALFLQMFLPSQMYNFPIWYISVMLVIGYCLYLWLSSKKNAI